MIRDMKNILSCQRWINGQLCEIRFVKAERSRCQEWKNYTSSTELRKAMSNLPNSVLKAALDEMALSADVLWRCKSKWVEKAKAQNNELITLDPLIDRVPDTGWLEKNQICVDDHEHQANDVESTEGESNQQDGIHTSQEDIAQEIQEQPKKRKRCESGDDLPSSIKDPKMAYGDG